MDRSRRLLDELKIAEARSDGMGPWSEPGRRVRREVRRLRAAWQREVTTSSWRDRTDDSLGESDAI